MPTNSQDYVVIIQSELLFFWIFIIIIFSWVSIDLVGRWINNFTFVTLQLNEKSPWHTFVIAITVIALLFASILFLKSINMDLEPTITNLPQANTDSSGVFRSPEMASFF